MKRIALTLFLLASTSAFAEDAKPKPTCGKSVEDCQKVVDDLTGKLGEMTLAYQGASAQRDANANAAAKSAADANLAAWINQQKAAIAAPSAKK